MFRVSGLLVYWPPLHIGSFWHWAVPLTLCTLSASRAASQHCRQIKYLSVSPNPPSLYSIHDDAQSPYTIASIHKHTHTHACTHTHTQMHSLTQVIETTWTKKSKFTVNLHQKEENKYTFQQWLSLICYVIQKNNVITICQTHVHILLYRSLKFKFSYEDS